MNPKTLSKTILIYIYSGEDSVAMQHSTNSASLSRVTASAPTQFLLTFSVVASVGASYVSSRVLSCSLLALLCHSSLPLEIRQTHFVQQHRLIERPPPTVFEHQIISNSCKSFIFLTVSLLGLVVVQFFPVTEVVQTIKQSFLIFRRRLLITTHKKGTNLNSNIFSNSVRQFQNGSHINHSSSLQSCTKHWPNILSNYNELKYNCRDESEDAVTEVSLSKSLE